MTGRPSRRQLFGYAGAAAAGAAVTGGAVVALDNDKAAQHRPQRRLISPYGEHQPAIAAPSPKHAELVALKLLPGTDKAALGRLMRLWSNDIVALANGRPAPGDTAPELAVANVALTTTVGFGPRVFELDREQAGRAR